MASVLSQGGEVVDPRDAQIERLKDVDTKLKERLGQQESELADLTAFKQFALSRIAAQHLEIERLRAEAGGPFNITHLPAPTQPVSGTIGSCS